MLTLNDGRSELWQWDTGRTLSVDADCSQVHFSNKVFGRSIDVDVTDGVAIIPDVLLQTDKDLNVWAFVGTADNGYTKISKTFKVNRRNKPADYVFTPPDQTSLEEIKERLEYIEQNPVEVPVQSVNGKTGAVTLTAEDVGAISKDDLQEATNEALAQAKASGEFDGADGKTPEYGVDYGTPEQITEIAQSAAEILQPELNQIKGDLGDITESSYKLEASNYPETYVEWGKRGLANRYINMPKIDKIVIKVKVDAIEEFKLIVFDRFENVEFVGLRPTDIYHEINVTPTETGEQDLEFVLPTEISGHFYVALQLVSGTQNKLAITNGKYSDKLQDAYSTTATGDTPRWYLATGKYYLCIKMYTKTFSAVDSEARGSIEGLDSRLNDLENENLNDRVMYLENAIPPKKHTRVILNFEQEDTVASEYYLERQKLLESYGFKGSFALSNLFFGNNGLNEAQINRVIELQNAGHDISLRGGVGGRPSDIDSTSEENQSLWDRYIGDAIKRAESIGIFNMVGYQCMNNVIGDALYNSLKKNGFKYARVYRSDKYGNDGTDYIKQYAKDGSMSVVNCFGFVNTTAFNSIKERIDTAVQNGWDFCLMSHNISDDPTYVQTLKSVYIQALDYLKTLHDNGTVDIVTWHELYQQDNYEKSNDFDYNRIIKKLNWLQTK